MGDLRAADLPVSELRPACGTSTSARGSCTAEPSRDLPALLAEARRLGLSTSVDPNDDPAQRVGLPPAERAAARRDASSATSPRLTASPGLPAGTGRGRATGPPATCWGSSPRAARWCSSAGPRAGSRTPRTTTLHVAAPAGRRRRHRRCRRQPRGGVPVRPPRRRRPVGGAARRRGERHAVHPPQRRGRGAADGRRGERARSCADLRHPDNRRRAARRLIDRRPEDRKVTNTQNPSAGRNGAADPLRDMIRRHKSGAHVGITSVCSAHPLVLLAALEHARETGGVVLIEATSNQVDQTGGYTGMRPEDFRELVLGLAEQVGLPAGRRDPRRRPPRTEPLAWNARRRGDAARRRAGAQPT